MLAQLARARARRKIAELEEALEGAEFFTAEHAALLATMLTRIDQLTAKIDGLTVVIERLLAPYEERYLAGMHRRDRRRGRQDPDPRRRPLPAAGPPPRQGQSPGRARQHPAEGLPQAPVQPRHAVDLGPDYYDRQASIRRQIAHHVGKLGALGFEVTLCRLPGADPDPSEPANTQAA